MKPVAHFGVPESKTGNSGGMWRFPLFCALLAPILAPVLFGSICFSMDRVNPKHECSSCHSLTVSEASTLLSPLNVKVKSVQLSPLRGLFEVSAERNGKSGLVFVNYAKTYAMQGVMVKMADLAKSDYSVKKTDEATTRAQVSRQLRGNAILMGSPAARTQIFVFTDPDCSFCRRMHAELQKLIGEMDVAVYVKLYPSQTHPDAYGKSRVIMGKNSLEFLNRAFAGEKIPDPTDADGKDAVEENIGLAKSLGIKGTPAILLPNGKIEVGYRDAAALKKLIEQNR